MENNTTSSNNSNTTDTTINKYAPKQPWKEDSEYFEELKKHVNNKHIESYARLQLEILDRAMDDIDYYVYVSFYYCYDTQLIFDRAKNEMVEVKGVNDEINQYNKKFLMMSLYKLIPCILIQLIVNPINIYYSISDTDNLCRNQNSVLLKLVASVLAIFSTVSSFTTIKTEIEKYGKLTFWFSDYYKSVRNFNNRTLIFTRMMSFFFFLNMYSSILTTIGTVFIIYNSNGVLEIVLNAMALKFIDEIDNITISKEEESKFLKLYNNIKEDIVCFQMDREYKELLGLHVNVPTSIIQRFSYGEIMLILCGSMTTLFTPVIVGYSAVYLGVCY
tara:strand:- start:10988 stop:11980 length:993 start_codon:yes stop_codon:yes gene_type:complete